MLHKTDNKHALCVGYRLILVVGTFTENYFLSRGWSVYNY